METKTFELSRAIDEWREALPNLPGDRAAELESHLLDSMAELQASGLSDAEAFSVACQRLGNVEVFLEEWAPVAVEASSRPWKRRLIEVALIFVGAVSLLAVIFGLLKDNRFRVKGVVEVREVRSGRPPRSLDEAQKEQLALLRTNESLDNIAEKSGARRRWSDKTTEAVRKQLSEMMALDWEANGYLNLRISGADPNEVAPIGAAALHQLVDNWRQSQRAAALKDGGPVPSSEEIAGLAIPHEFPVAPLPRASSKQSGLMAGVALAGLLCLGCGWRLRKKPHPCGRPCAGGQHQGFCTRRRMKSLRAVSGME